VSTFKVTVEKLSKVYIHPNAEKLELAQVEGMSFQFCVRKDEYKANDLVVYCPVDSLLPQTLIEFLGIGNMLSGKDKNRVKTIKLRGSISQGFVVKITTIAEYLNKMMIVAPEGVSIVGTDLTTVLGVTKYEPPEVPCHAGRLVPLPAGISHYDIEGCQRYPAVVEELMNQSVCISEKVEGSNFWASLLPASLLPDDTFIVGQRNFEIKPIDGHTHSFWKVAEELCLHEKLIKIKEQRRDYKHITLRGEAIGSGLNGNLYKLNKVTFLAFDLLVDGRYVAPMDFLDICGDHKIETVPQLASGWILKEWLEGKTIIEASHGKSALADTLREGIVVKPETEQYSEILGGRLFLKQRDPIYLDKTGN